MTVRSEERSLEDVRLVPLPASRVVAGRYLSLGARCLPARMRAYAFAPQASELRWIARSLLTSRRSLPSVHAVVDARGNRVGLLSCAMAADALELHWIFIDPAHARRGFGRAAMVQLECLGITLGARRVILSVDTRNRRAWNLYRTLDFVPLGDEVRYWLYRPAGPLPRTLPAKLAGCLLLSGRWRSLPSGQRATVLKGGVVRIGHLEENELEALTKIARNQQARRLIFSSARRAPGARLLATVQQMEKRIESAHGNRVDPR